MPATADSPEFKAQQEQSGQDSTSGICNFRENYDPGTQPLARLRPVIWQPASPHFCREASDDYLRPAEAVFTCRITLEKNQDRPKLQMFYLQKCFHDLGFASAI